MIRRYMHSDKTKSYILYYGPQKRITLSCHYMQGKHFRRTLLCLAFYETICTFCEIYFLHVNCQAKPLFSRKLKIA